MTPPIIVLDSGPLFLITKRVGLPEADACRAWTNALISAGHTIITPEIADYECRRELHLQPTDKALQRLEAFHAAAPGRFLPLTSDALRYAAQLWATARKSGVPTSDPLALDGDVILAGQVLTAGFPAGSVIVATTNVKHISRFLPADTWRNITP